MLACVDGRGGIVDGRAAHIRSWPSGSRGRQGAHSCTPLVWMSAAPFTAHGGSPLKSSQPLDAPPVSVGSQPENVGSQPADAAQRSRRVADMYDLGLSER